MDSKLEQAREWTELVNPHWTERARAAAEVIQSLPDQWIDADKLRQIIDFQGTSISEEARKDLESLIPPRPEDVPAGEPWIVQHEDREWIGCRNDPGTRLPWLVIGKGDDNFNFCYDVDITLVSRLVPESKENA